MSARALFVRLTSHPNPILMRELRQSVRLTRTPFLLMSLTIVATLLISGIGGSLGKAQRSDVVGQAIYQTFFSFAFFVTAWAGPAVAANSIASEREGRTWEAVLLTGLSPSTLARGKFLSAFTSMAAYLFMVAPVGALCFLFGGVDLLEVVIGYGYLFAFAAVFVAFGLSVSSKMATSRGAIVVTLLLAVPTSGFLFGIFGPASSALVNELWPRVTSGAPVWLPLAYVRGELGAEYFLLLFVAPIVVLVLPTWFLYASTVANLTEPTADRSSGLKRWFIGATGVLVTVAIAGVLTVPSRIELVAVVVVSTVVLVLHFLTCLSVFMGEPLDASRRVRYAWDRAGVGKVGRWLGPGMERTLKLVAIAVVVAGGLMVSVAYLRSETLPLPLPMRNYGLPGAFRFAAFLFAFVLFVIGLTAWIRSRSHNLFVARLLLGVVIGVLAIVPWIFTAFIGITSDASTAVLFGSPSPFFAILLFEYNTERVAAGLFMGTLWVIGGALFFVAAVRRSRAAVSSWDDAHSQADRRLAAEDAMAESRVPAES